MPETCPEHASMEQTLLDLREGQKRVEGKLERILTRLGDGDVTFATLTLRVRILELLVYGGTGLALTALIVALLRGVIS